MKKVLCLAVLLCLLLSLCGCSATEGVAIPVPTGKTLSGAAESGSSQSAPEISPAVLAIRYDPSPNLSGELTSFQLQVREQVLAFPMTYEQLTALGWRGDGSAMVRAAGRTSVPFTRGGLTLSFFAYNSELEERPCTQCQISGVSTWLSGATAADCIYLPGALRLGEASEKEILAAYSQPNTSYAINKSQHFRYQTEGIYDVIELILDGDGVLAGCELDHPDVPRDFTHSVNEYIADMGEYETPQKLEGSIRDRVVEFCGDLYRLPVPVSELEKNGWIAEELTVSAGAIEFVSMRRGDVEFHVTVHNETGGDCSVSETWIQALSSADVPGEHFAVSGGVDQSLTEDALKELIAAEGLTYDTMFVGRDKRYSIPLSDRDWEDYCDVVFQNGVVTYIQLAYRGKED